MASKWPAHILALGDAVAALRAAAGDVDTDFSDRGVLDPMNELRDMSEAELTEQQARAADLRRMADEAEVKLQRAVHAHLARQPELAAWNDGGHVKTTDATGRGVVCSDCRVAMDSPAWGLPCAARRAT